MTFLCLICLLCGCAASPAPAHAPTTARPAAQREGRVILLRGAYFGAFSKGLDQLAADLCAAGIDATVHPHHGWKRLARQLRGDASAGPLILVGHSYGADAAVYLARELGRSGQSVALLITLDLVTAPATPRAVDRHWNVYQASPGTFNPPLFKGRAAVAEVDSHPSVENLNLWTDENDLHERRLSHWNLTEQPKLQQAIIDRILGLCPQRHD